MKFLVFLGFALLLSAATTTQAPPPPPTPNALAPTHTPPPPTSKPIGSVIGGGVLFLLFILFLDYYCACLVQARVCVATRPRVLVREARVSVGIPTCETAVMATLRSVREAEVVLKDVIAAASYLADVVHARDVEADALHELVVGGEAVEAADLELGRDQLVLQIRERPAIDRDANLLDEYIEYANEAYESFRETQLMVVLRMFTQTYDHCNPLFISIMKPGVLLYFYVRMFWPVLLYLMGRNAPKWRSTWVPV